MGDRATAPPMTASVTRRLRSARIIAKAVPRVARRAQNVDGDRQACRWRRNRPRRRPQGRIAWLERGSEPIIHEVLRHAMNPRRLRTVRGGGRVSHIDPQQPWVQQTLYDAVQQEAVFFAQGALGVLETQRWRPRDLPPGRSRWRGLAASAGDYPGPARCAGCRTTRTRQAAASG